jgi:hypothetical protein
MPIAKFHKQRRVRRGVYKARFTKQRQNWRGTTKAAATPTLASISPTNVDEDAANTTVTLTGTGFVSGVTRATVNGGDVSTTYVSATSLTIVLPASMLVDPGTLSISVHSGLLVAPTPQTFTINDVVEP